MTISQELCERVTQNETNGKRTDNERAIWNPDLKRRPALPDNQSFPASSLVCLTVCVCVCVCVCVFADPNQNIDLIPNKKLICQSSRSFDSIVSPSLKQAPHPALCVPLKAV